MRKIWHKKATGVDTSEFAKMASLASLKSDSDKLDIDKLKTVPLEIGKVSKIVDNNVVKKNESDEFATIVNE